MYESINLNHSLYTIYLELTENQFISVGKLGAFSFQKGTYVYVGSAKRNIKQRIERHKKTIKNSIGISIIFVPMEQLLEL